MYINKSEKSSIIVKHLYDYMTSEGFEFSIVATDDSSPYAILRNNTSVSFRKYSRKWKSKGIVMFCAADGRDKERLKNGLGLKVENNEGDPARPYAVFIPDELFEKAVELLK